MTGKTEASRRQRAVVVAALGAVLLGAAGVATWAITRARAPAGLPARPDQAAAATETAPPPAVGAPVEGLAAEPAPPPVGSPIRQPYFAALAAGDQRGLAVVRQALDAARSGNGSPDTAYLRRLEALERSYTERLERHSREANDR